MDIKKLIVTAPIAAMSLLVACGDDSSSNNSSSPANKEVFSCYIYDAEDSSESCAEAEVGTTSADSLKLDCEETKASASEDLKIETGKGCPAEKKALHTCKSSAPRDYTIYYYALDEGEKELVVKGDEAKTCENLVEGEAEPEQAFISCYVKNVDSETNEVEETCTQAATDNVMADSIRYFCNNLKNDPAFEGTIIKLGSGCSEEKVLHVCTEADFSSEREDIPAYTTYFYSLNDEQKQLIKDVDDDKVCDKLDEYFDEELADDISGNDEE